jgi:hypothetical protein
MATVRAALLLVRTIQESAAAHAKSTSSKYGNTSSYGRTSGSASSIRSSSSSSGSSSSSSSSSTSSVFATELSAVADLQAMLCVQEFSSASQQCGTVYSIDIAGMLDQPSSHERLLRLRKSVTAIDGRAVPTTTTTTATTTTTTTTTTATTAGKMCLSEAMPTTHSVSITNGIHFADITQPCSHWAIPSKATPQLHIVGSLLRTERSRVQSIEEMLNDDCFAILRLSSKMPFVPTDTTDTTDTTNYMATPTDTCRRLHIFACLLQCIDDCCALHSTNSSNSSRTNNTTTKSSANTNTSTSSTNTSSSSSSTLQLYSGTVTVIVNLCVDLLEHGQTHRAEEQVLGLGLLYRTLDMASGSDLLAFAYWILPKLMRMLR